MGFQIFLEIIYRRYQKTSGLGAKSGNIRDFAVLMIKFVVFIDFTIPSAESVSGINQIAEKKVWNS